MLASDVNNPEFVGAIRNPDQLLNTEFFWREVDVLDPEKTQYTEMVAQNGMKYKAVDGTIFHKKERQPWIKIWRAGDMTTIIEVAVRDEHKQRWPDRWQAWQMQEGLIDNGANVPGWQITEWDGVNSDQRRELKYLGFHTVEQIAGATDTQVQRMGMGGPGIRDSARRAVLARAQNSAVAAVEAKDKAQAEENAALRAELAELRAMISKKKAA